MFFRKKEERKKRERAETRQRMLDEAARRLDEAQAQPDLAERILRLKRLEDDIDKDKQDIYKEAQNDAFGRGFRNGFGVFAAAVAGTIWVAASISGWGLLLIIPGIYATAKIGGRSSEKLEDSRHAENKEFYRAMGDRLTAVRELENALVKDEWAAIAKSAKAKEAFSAVPQLREIYAASFCKGVANGDIATQGGASSSPVATDKDAQSAVTSQAPIGISHSLKLKKPGNL